MPSGKVASWVYCEEFAASATLFGDESVLDRANERASELGVAPVLPGAGSMLRLLAASLDAHAVVEIGTGAGVSALHLLAGMNESGVLTTIDPEFENQRAARETVMDAGIRPARVRTIAGSPREVAARLTDHAYDMVCFPADAPHALELLEHAERLLRPGGVLVVTNVLYHDQVADPAIRDAQTVQVRELLQAVRTSPSLQAALTPSGDGVLAAVRSR